MTPRFLCLLLQKGMEAYNKGMKEQQERQITETEKIPGEGKGKGNEMVKTYRQSST